MNTLTFYDGTISFGNNLPFMIRLSDPARRCVCTCEQRFEDLLREAETEWSDHDLRLSIERYDDDVLIVCTTTEMHRDDESEAEDLAELLGRHTCLRLNTAARLCH